MLIISVQISRRNGKLGGRIVGSTATETVGRRKQGAVSQMS